ncbi:hypothetical protein NQ317_019163 [Molorchus minor]|uniref:guanylate cyclase n=1 Tax=Molorchus minor TaxID=1323400 RepID=A0ABQ9JA30_9CUCU|nr:hypothetical protein NQ317_019163 [Molorchus minor]
MYGMLMESVQHFVQGSELLVVFFRSCFWSNPSLQLEYGEDIWKQILKVANCKYTIFKTHQNYPDEILPALAAACATVTNASYDSFMNFFGRCFVRFFTILGYDVTIRATGRYFTDFLESVDNIHTQFRFTYPKMQSPSMYLTTIDANGCILVYRSGRQGFTQYIMGQLQQIAKDFYSMKINVKVLERASSASGSKNYVIVTFRIDFDNRAYMLHKAQKDSFHQVQLLSPFPCKMLLELFPFGIILNTEMRIMGCGDRFIEIWRGEEHFLNRPMGEYFEIRRPKGIPFTWKKCKLRLNYRFVILPPQCPISFQTLNLQSVMFELEFNRNTTYSSSSHSEEGDRREEETASPDAGTKNILLKGQMKYIRDINAIIFLCSPVINDLDELPNLGLYLNDLNPHGLSKELVLAGWQHNSRLEMMFDKAEQRSDELGKSYELLDTWKRRGDDLLYSMIPKPVADRLRTGQSSLSTCESFEAVSILFCELVGLTSKTVKETMVVVTTMNAVFSCFDELMDKFNVYKVETVGQVYMVASGAPERTDLHAQSIADLALAMTYEVKGIKTPSGNEVVIRIGIHSGPAVAGVVGIKVPRYCFLEIPSILLQECNRPPGKINISSDTNKLLPSEKYVKQSRGGCPSKATRKMARPEFGVNKMIAICFREKEKCKLTGSWKN